MIKQSREKRKVQGFIRALLSPVKDSKSSMASPSKESAVTDESPVSGLKVSRRMWVGGETPPVGSLLGIAPSPCTPPDDDDDDRHSDLMTPTPATQHTPQHVPGATPELRASLPTQPLTQWTEGDVAACLRILGREMAREGTNRARDVSAFDAYAETFAAKGIDGAKFASITIPQLNHELGVSNFNHRLKIVSWIKAYLEDIICPALAMPDSPPPTDEREYESPDAKDRAIANLSMKLHDMQQALCEAQSRQAALDGTSQETSPLREEQRMEANEPDEQLTAALAEANAKMLQYNQDATEAHEAMMKAVYENEKLEAALKKYDEVMPEIKRSNDRLREETVATLATMQSQFADAVARAEAKARQTVQSLEEEKRYEESRNAALHARNRQLYNQIQDLKGAIRVYTRIRPVAAAAAAADGDGAAVCPGRCLDPAAEGADVVCKPPAGKLSGTGERRPAGRRAEEKRFSFDKVFGPESTQGDVYDELSPLVRGILDGYNVCIFAYGQTGSGKTYTMGGPGDATGRNGGGGGGGGGGAEGKAERGRGEGDDTTAGVNTRALRELFESAGSRAAGADGAAFTVSVEMREIYNEQVRDLLNPAEKEETWNGVKRHAAPVGGNDNNGGGGGGGGRPGSARDKSTSGGGGCGGGGDDEEGSGGGGGGGVTRVVARDAAHVLDIMAEGTARRASAGTALNERSSRSHSVVTVYAEGTTHAASGRTINGRLHLIDLAGSERVGRSEAKGDRLKEAQHINKSLSALGDVIAALLEKRAHVPYRNSQLTRLLCDSLSGNSKVVLLAHLAPEAASLPETQSTLLFAQRCSQVELGKAKVNATAAPAGAASEAALAAIAKYKGELEQTRGVLDEEKARASQAEEKAAAAEEKAAAAEEEAAALRKDIESLKKAAAAAAAGAAAAAAAAAGAEGATKDVSAAVGGANPYVARRKSSSGGNVKGDSAGAASLPAAREPLKPAAREPLNPADLNDAGRSDGGGSVGSSSAATTTPSKSFSSRPRSAIPAPPMSAGKHLGTPGDGKTPGGGTRPKSAALSRAAITASSSILKSSSSSSASRRLSGAGPATVGTSDGGRWQ